MKRPALFWIAFALCLSLIFPAMAWLTYSALELDRQIQDDRIQTELARREAELQEKITSALYRMDWKLGPHIAREAAQPYYMYESFYNLPSLSNAPAESSAWQTGMPSPLLYEDAEFVKLHFQVGTNGVFTSPKRPTGKREIAQAASCCNVNAPQIFACDSQLEKIRSFASFEKLKQKIGDASVTSDHERVAELVYSPAQIDEFVKFNSDKIQSSQVLRQTMETGNSSPISKSLLQNLRVRDRGGKEFLKRKSAYDDNTSQWAAANQRGNYLGNNDAQLASLTKTRKFIEGVMRPIWIDGELLLVRKVIIDGSHRFQGCWLDWEKIQQALRKEVEDILPDIEFEPLLSSKDLSPGRALVTLPAQVVVDTPRLLDATALTSSQLESGSDSGVTLAIFLAWLGLAISAAALGMLLYGVIRLSERRASFVSAVTHELRTPLTTFKMYSEMLAAEMVPPDKQKQYAQTLSQQADRLSHLVENVLQFARLEQGADRNLAQQIVMSDELIRITERLEDRCRLARMQLDTTIQDQVIGKTVVLDVHSLEQILFNLIDNACKYASNADSKTIQLDISCNNGYCTFVVRDFGPGVEPKFRKRLFQPFCKSDQEAANTASGVGLGLALCRRMANSLGGTLTCRDAVPGAIFELAIPWRT